MTARVSVLLLRRASAMIASDLPSSGRKSELGRKAGQRRVGDVAGADHGCEDPRDRALTGPSGPMITKIFWRSVLPLSTYPNQSWSASIASSSSGQSWWRNSSQRVGSGAFGS